MNTMAAVDETMKVAIVRAGIDRPKNMEMYNHSSLGMQHLVDMHARMNVAFSDDKLNRWLGWMQAAIVSWDIGLTQKDMAEINRKHA